MSVYPLDYHCNGLAIKNHVEQYYFDNIILCILMFLCFSSIFVRFWDLLQTKVLRIFQYLQQLWNIANTFKAYYSFYTQLQQLCQDTFHTDLPPRHETFEQTEPPSQEYTIEVCKQIQQPTHMLPPPEEFITQVRDQIYLPTLEEHFSSTLLLCIDNQDLQFLAKKASDTTPRPNWINLP